MKKSIGKLLTNLKNEGLQATIMSWQSTIGGLCSHLGIRIKTKNGFSDIYGSTNALLFAETTCKKSDNYRLFQKPIEKYEEELEQEIDDWEEENGRELKLFEKRLDKATTNEDRNCEREKIRKLIEDRPYKFTDGMFCSGNVTPQGLVKRANQGSKTITIFSEEPGDLKEPLNLEAYGGKQLGRTNRGILLKTMLGGAIVELWRSDPKKCVPKTFLRTGICGMMHEEDCWRFFASTAWRYYNDGFIERFMFYRETFSKNGLISLQNFLKSYKKNIELVIKNILDLIKIEHRKACKLEKTGRISAKKTYYKGPAIEFESEELRKEFMDWCEFKTKRKKKTHIPRAWEKLGQILLQQVLWDEVSNGNYDIRNWKITREQFEYGKTHVEEFGIYRQIQGLIPCSALSEYSRKNTEEWVFNNPPKKRNYYKYGDEDKILEEEEEEEEEERDEFEELLIEKNFKDSNFVKRSSFKKYNKERREISEYEAIEALEAIGIERPDRCLKEEGFTRWGRNDEGKKNAKYSARFVENKDGTSKGVFVEDFTTGEKQTLWPSKKFEIDPLSFEEMEKRKKKQIEIEKKKKAKQEKLAIDIQQQIKKNNLKLASKIKHPYLVNKNIDGHGAYVATENMILGESTIYKGRLLIVIRDIYGNITGAQSIDINGEKYILKNTELKGNYAMAIGDYNDTNIIIAEGYATAISALNKFSGKIAIITIGATNMPEAAKSMAKIYGEYPIIICGDNDDAGRKAAQKAAANIEEQIGIRPRIEFPNEKYKDFNDEENCIEK